MFGINWYSSDPAAWGFGFTVSVFLIGLCCLVIYGWPVYFVGFSLGLMLIWLILGCLLILFCVWSPLVCALFWARILMRVWLGLYGLDASRPLFMVVLGRYNSHPFYQFLPRILGFYLDVCFQKFLAYLDMLFQRYVVYVDCRAYFGHWDRRS